MLHPSNTERHKMTLLNVPVYAFFLMGMFAPLMPVFLTTVLESDGLHLTQVHPNALVIRLKRIYNL
jgi:hypothetical protein